MPSRRSVLSECSVDFLVHVHRRIGYNDDRYQCIQKLNVLCCGYYEARQGKCQHPFRQGPSRLNYTAIDSVKLNSPPC